MLSPRPLNAGVRLLGKTMLAATDPNAYLMAFFTALLAGLFSLAGSYVIARFQARQATVAKSLEYRTKAYTDFLTKIGERSPLIGRLLNIGSLADRVVTDGAIQEFEDRVAELFVELDLHATYAELNSDFNFLRLHGDEATERICRDILALLSFRDGEVDWSKYPQETQLYYQQWRTNQEGPAYGWDPSITNDQRIMVIMVAKLFDELVSHLRGELARR